MNTDLKHLEEEAVLNSDGAWHTMLALQVQAHAQYLEWAKSEGKPSTLIDWYEAKLSLIEQLIQLEQGPPQ